WGPSSAPFTRQCGIVAGFVSRRAKKRRVPGRSGDEDAGKVGSGWGRWNGPSASALVGGVAVARLRASAHGIVRPRPSVEAWEFVTHDSRCDASEPCGTSPIAPQGAKTAAPFGIISK